MGESVLSSINTPSDLKKLSVEKLPLLAEEIRQKIIEITCKNGGHLGSNLGAVELTIALHYIFDFSRDRLIWDVSHQCYAHKILTGRKDRFDTIRLYQGLSGFTNPEESPYDTFIVGHAGTSISTALGIATGDSFSNRERKVVSVCGDGALTCGMNLEALNYAGILKKNLIVVLNDNKMSISTTVGAMANYLTKLRTSYLYQDLKKDVYSLLSHIPKGIGHQMERALDHIRAAALSPLGGAIFEELGWSYFGPIDGHNIRVLCDNFRTISQLSGPRLLHIVTEKGYGSEDASSDPYKMHGIGPLPAKAGWERKDIAEPLKIADGKISQEKKPSINYTDIFADSITELATKDERIVGITAAMPDGTGLVKLQEKFPHRYFDVGICEQQAVGFACGMAKAGMKPVCAIYSTFLQRAFDQLFHEIALQKMPVVFVLDRAGLVGADGPTHHGLYDIAYCRVFPDFVLMAPRDGEELKQLLLFAVNHPKPCFIRYPRTVVPEPIIAKEEPKPQISQIIEGRAEILRKGKDGALLGYGSMVYPAYFAAEELHQEGIDLTVVNARFAKPLDKELVGSLLQESPFIITLEEHSIIGGFGSAVLEFANQSDQTRKNTGKIISLAVPDRFIEHGPRDKLLESLGLDKAGIINTVRKMHYKKV
ncbi:MAG: 1-deoxy-D-xylulose-5-phosphate synthase [Planctomycetota bacterium]|nr:1-deoxy-D-xylulose-5-phosphate synthase [Planctomycetota bacterium]MDI6787045.1 1-deoxy-D-xylulose-5-phosphate synthase [Planctomycetota bacterium]